MRGRWIPAFAGMTRGWNHAFLLVTPAKEKLDSGVRRNDEGEKGATFILHPDESGVCRHRIVTPTKVGVQLAFVDLHRSESNISLHSGFDASISAIFHARFHSLICFSRRIA